MLLTPNHVPHSHVHHLSRLFFFTLSYEPNISTIIFLTTQGMSVTLTASIKFIFVLNVQFKKWSTITNYSRGAAAPIKYIWRTLTPPRGFLVESRMYVYGPQIWPGETLCCSCCFFTKVFFPPTFTVHTDQSFLLSKNECELVRQENPRARFQHGRSPRGSSLDATSLHEHRSNCQKPLAAMADAPTAASKRIFVYVLISCHV